MAAVPVEQFSSADYVRQGELLQQERVRHGQVQLPGDGQSSGQTTSSVSPNKFPGEGDTVSVGAVQYSTLYSALQHRVAARYIIDIITALH